jgi:hypothetical protein
VEPSPVTIVAPAQTPETEFQVSWAATDSASQISHYTLEYSGTLYTGWQPWLPVTTLKSAFFTAPATDQEYKFRVTAYDRAGNYARAITSVRVGLYRAYLPLAIRYWAPWYEYDVYEPNDSPEQAYGPLKSGQVYRAYIWNGTDQDDYYHFTPSSAANARITLSNIPSSCDLDLYIYHYVGGQYQLVAFSNRTGNATEQATLSTVAGNQYLVRVYRYAGSSTQQPYQLEAVYD